MLTRSGPLCAREAREVLIACLWVARAGSMCELRQNGFWRPIKAFYRITDTKFKGRRGPSPRMDGPSMTNDPQNSFTEKDVASRINRYSRLRSVERALRPSVRRRVSLGAAGPREGLLRRLQLLLESTRRAEAGVPVELPEIESVDFELDTLSQRLTDAIRTTPLVQLRATLPHVVGAHRGDAVALLDFWLETMDWDHDPIYLIEYLITLLSTDEIDGRVTLVRDPASVSDGVGRACMRQAGGAFEPEEVTLREASSRLRATSVDLLAEEDLEATIVAMRALKSRVGSCFFDRDFLRSVVQYNATVKNRFSDLAEAAPAREGVVERTLAALRALDFSAIAPAAAV